MSDTERTLGEHTAQLDALKGDIAEIKADVKLLVASENKREGAKKVVYTLATLLGGISGTVAAKFLK